MIQINGILLIGMLNIIINGQGSNNKNTMNMCGSVGKQIWQPKKNRWA